MTSDPWERCAQDTRPTEDLVALYLAGATSEESGHALAIIHYRGGPEELAHGARLARSTNETERVAGANILAQLGWTRCTHLEESVDILLGLLDDSSEEVVYAAAIALGHRGDPRAIAPLINLVGHASAEIRFGVAFGLSGHDASEAIEALISLTEDPDRDVRDWATFGLAQQTDLDTPAIREALHARSEDDDPEIRGEALLGLARRRDKRALSLVGRELEGEFHGDWAVEAAGMLAEPSLYPLLEALYQRLDPEDQTQFKLTFQEALDLCRPRL